MNRSIGNAAERQACEYLRQQGLRFVMRNYTCPLGEIDLVMLDGKTLVFVEVRKRRFNYFGGASYSIDKKKQQHILNSCKHYLAFNNKYDKISCRIDVVLISGADDSEILWIKNAIIE